MPTIQMSSDDNTSCQGMLRVVAGASRLDMSEGFMFWLLTKKFIPYIN